MPLARPAISFDNAGFLINGQRTVIMSGSIHYPRVPHELWTDRLRRLKRCNFNTVQTYAFWNYSETKKNQFNFTGDGDISKFLSTAQKLGLYATVRPGPYVCAEWDFGGFPLWLKFEGDVVVRSADPAYLALNDHWYQKIIPIIAEHQINRGGNVILVQLENEHPAGSGILEDNPYFQHLHDEAVQLGLEVPHFMSGLNHGHSPSPENIDPALRRNPWMTTEFWAGWFDAYRTLPANRYREIDQAQWAILGHGGGGYNFYMIHGGTNFDSWNDQETGASYDYGAAIGQAGDLRPMYYKMKRVNQIGQSFPNILADSVNAVEAYKDFVSGPGIEVLGARKSDAGTLVFIRNSRSEEGIAVFKSGETLNVSPEGTYPIPQNVTLDESIKIVDGTVPILGLARNDQVTTVIVYGHPGKIGRLTFSGDVTPGTTVAGIDVSSPKNGKIDLTIEFPEEGVEECQLDGSTRSIRILAINQDLSLYTWIVGEEGKQYVVFGPDFVQDLQEINGKMSLKIERPYGKVPCGQVAVYGAKSRSWHLAVHANPSMDSEPPPVFSAWQMAITSEQAPDFDDAKWLRTSDPEQMGSDGDHGPFAWYRTLVDIPRGGRGMLHLHGLDEVRVYINGKYASGDQSVSADFVEGKNTIAVLVSHRGRYKQLGYIGSLEHRDDKGLFGPVTLDFEGRHLDLKGWEMRGGPGDVAQIGSWGDAGETQDVPVFYRATFMAKPPGEIGAYPILRVKFAGLSRGTMWINGHNLGQYPEKINIDGLYVPECWLKDGSNDLMIFDTHGAKPSKVRLAVEKEASREVIFISEPVDPTTPIVVAPE
jgi:beta-galactosidase